MNNKGEKFKIWWDEKENVLRFQTLTDSLDPEAMMETLGRAKEIIIHKRDRSNLELSDKIEIDDVDFEGWKVSGKMQIRAFGDYLRIYIYRKQS